QSAAVLVVRVRGGYDGRLDRYVDLRVDDHPQPIAELKRILGLHRLYLTKSAPDELLAVNEDITREVQAILHQAGRYQGQITGVYDEVTRKALCDLYSIENLEERWHDELIDVVALNFLRQRFK
ncbi:MAG: fimbrial assembly protein FimA, partial [Bacteroidales bacterium]